MSIPKENEYFFTRIFQLNSGGEVRLDIAQPRLFPEGQDYMCPYRILGLSNPHESFAGGVDSIQSFLLALHNAASVLIGSTEYRSQELYWLEPGERDLGLPVPDAFK
jgi:hypothetical protein